MKEGKYTTMAQTIYDYNQEMERRKRNKYKYV
jgi:hypothetical protein